MSGRRLNELLTATRAWAVLGAADLRGDGDVVISGVEHDSRQVRPGALFCCVVGAHADGHDHAGEAVEKGAVALLVERPLPLDVPQVVVASVRAAVGPLAAAAAGDPSRDLRVVGVTGTNGKTTTTHFLASILTDAGLDTSVIGTLSGPRTTPEAPALQALLSDARDDGFAAVAMEVSSHALDFHRVDGTRFAVAVFTNLSQDHLDQHGTMAAYFQAKARLFDPELSDLAVVNLDDPHGRLLRDAAQIPTVGYSRDEAEDVVLDPSGTAFTWQGVRFRVPVAGWFNVDNALAALHAAQLLGVDAEAAVSGLAGVSAVPGRFEVVDAGQPFLVVVDFAHTPDGLENLLVAGRDVAPDGKVLVVFGAGGDRDRTKRPEMGAVASRLADRVFLTSDNPRGEDPSDIIEDVRSGMAGHAATEVEPDRRAAIAAALRAAAAGDVVFIAGKGHEATQTVGPHVIAFDDRVVAREELARLGYEVAS